MDRPPAARPAPTPASPRGAEGEGEVVVEAVPSAGEARTVAAPVVDDLTEAGVRAVASVERGPLPPPGLQQTPYLWADVLDGAPPHATHGGARGFVVYHTMELDEDVRLSHSTLVRAAPGLGNGASVQVDCRITVQRRALLERIDAARRWADAWAARRREVRAERLARHRAWAARVHSAARPAAQALVAVEARASRAVLRGVPVLVRGAAEVPDRLLTAGMHTQAMLGDRLGRRSLWESLKDPGSLTPEQKSVVVFLTLALLGMAVLVLNNIVALLLPGVAETYRGLLAGAMLQFVGLFGIPIVVEPLFVGAVLAYGWPLALAAFFAGKMAAAWMLYFVGDSIHDTAHARGGARTQRFMEWLHRNANKYGFAILVLDNAVPLAPDQVMMVLAVSGINFRTWMVAITLGTLIRFGALILGTHLVGPERIEAFFANPFGGL